MFMNLLEFTRYIRCILSSVSNKDFISFMTVTRCWNMTQLIQLVNHLFLVLAHKVWNIASQLNINPDKILLWWQQQSVRVPHPIVLSHYSSQLRFFLKKYMIFLLANVINLCKIGSKINVFNNFKIWTNLFAKFYALISWNIDTMWIITSQGMNVLETKDFVIINCILGRLQISTFYNNELTFDKFSFYFCYYFRFFFKLIQFFKTFFIFHRLFRFS